MPVLDHRGPRRSPWTVARLRKWYTVSSDGCWLWETTSKSKGYGLACENARQILAHRLSWALFNGPVPPGMCVCHKCDVRACVNPEHLFVGTYTDNMQDAAAKGRTLTGDRNPRRRTAKLTKQDAADIRRRREHGELGTSLAREYRVSESCVCDAYKGRHWL